MQAPFRKRRTGGGHALAIDRRSLGRRLVEVVAARVEKRHQAKDDGRRERKEHGEPQYPTVHADLIEPGKSVPWRLIEIAGRYPRRHERHEPTDSRSAEEIPEGTSRQSEEGAFDEELAKERHRAPLRKRSEPPFPADVIPPGPEEGLPHSRRR